MRSETPPSTRPRLVRWLRGAALVGTGLLLAGLLTVLVLLWNLPLATDFREPTRLALAIEDRDGRPLAYRGVSPSGTLALSAMPAHLPLAFIAFEDRRFRNHPGVDVVGILRATVVNAGAMSWRQGASTITQQLVKNTFLSPQKTLTRKIQEAAIALWLERQLSKDAILERYLNSVYLGAGAHGVDAATRRYFAKPASEATLAEAAMLAGLAQAPSRTAPTVALETAQERASLVLDAMVETGAISPEQAAEAKATPATLAVAPVPPAGAAYAADWAAATVRADLGDLSGSLVVRTTIDPSLQDLAVAHVHRILEAEGNKADATEAALVAMRPDGQVLAVVGGADSAASEFNRAVQARRQPGSLFKLFVYLAALQSGVRPDDRIDDRALTIDGWSPRNHDGRFHGTVTVRDAFAHSYNAAAVSLQERVGRDGGDRSRPIDGDLRPDRSAPEPGARHQRGLAGRGDGRVRRGQGRQDPGPGADHRRPDDAGRSRRSACPPTTRPTRRGRGRRCWTCCARPSNKGTGRAARLPIPAYGKTGTTQDNRDAWFVGFAGDLVVGVWVGNDDDRPMRDVSGGGMPARLWRAFMVDALKGAPAPGSPAAGPGIAAGPKLEGRAEVVDTATLRTGRPAGPAARRGRDGRVGGGRHGRLHRRPRRAVPAGRGRPAPLRGRRLGPVGGGAVQRWRPGVAGRAGRLRSRRAQGQGGAQGHLGGRRLRRYCGFVQAPPLALDGVGF